LGVALLQFEGEDKGWLPVGFASRKMKGEEPRYTTTEKECLAIVFGLRKFRHLLLGEDFEVGTDHIALTWLLSQREPKERLARSWRFKPSDLRYFTSEETENIWQCLMH
jgi:RNase H-like domain found in reverse transcriptase